MKHAFPLLASDEGKITELDSRESSLSAIYSSVTVQRVSG
jgi:hypothetical protein